MSDTKETPAGLFDANADRFAAELAASERAKNIEAGEVNAGRFVAEIAAERAKNIKAWMAGASNVEDTEASERRNAYQALAAAWREISILATAQANSPTREWGKVKQSIEWLDAIVKMMDALV